MKPKTRKALTKVTNFLNKPMVRGVSKFSASLLSTVYLIRENRNPLAYGVAGLSVLNSIAESFDLPQYSPLESFVRSENLKINLGSLPKLLYLSDYYKVCEKDTVFSSDDELLTEITLNGEKLYILEFKNVIVSGSGPSAQGQKISEEYYHTKDFNFELLFDKIWEDYKDGLFLKRQKINYGLEVSKIPADKFEYIGSHDLNKLNKEIERAHKRDISRSYLLVGEPGVGKTSFVMQLAKRHYNRVIRLDPHLTRTLESGELEFFVEQMKPEVLVFEDFDRAYGAVEVALSMLENLKRNYPHLVVFATVNDMSKLDRALVRPGRFDKILKFDLPDFDCRKKILDLYFKKYNKEQSDAVLSSVASATEELTPVYLKELAIESINFDEETWIDDMTSAIVEYQERIIQERNLSYHGYDDNDELSAEEAEQIVSQMREENEG